MLALVVAATDDFCGSRNYKRLIWSLQFNIDSVDDRILQSDDMNQEFLMHSYNVSFN